MSGKYALIIGNTEYADRGLAQLTAPGKDAEDFARVLKDQSICAFDDVKILLNQPEHIVRRAIEVYFDQRRPDDLIVLYFSGHGIRDESGALYLAVKNTVRTRLRSTAIKSDYIREIIDQSRSKRQVLILDCCNSGAFARGTKAATDVSIGTASAFEAGYGCIILTASDSIQFAWEGDQVIGNTDNSLFTHYLVEGLEGEADLDSDGRISVDELYDYAYERVKLATPKQTPSKFSSKQQGEIVLRQSIKAEDIKLAPLPAELIEEIEDTRPYVREAAVNKLERILKGKNIGLTRSAIEALEKISTDENTTRRVSQAATRALEGFLQAAPNTEKVTKAQTDPETEESKAAEQGANKKHLEPQRIEDARITQANQQLKRKLQFVPSPQATEKKLSEQPVQRASTPKLTSIVLGVTLIFSLCVGGGWAIWRYFLPQMPTEPPVIPPIKLMTSEVPSAIIITPTHAATMTLTPFTFTQTITKTVTPFSPQEPDQFMIFYFETVIYKRDYELASSLLSDTFKTNNNLKDVEDLKKVWGPVVEWRQPIFTKNYILPTQVIVSTPEIWFRASKWYPLTNLNYCLVRDESRNTWTITSKVVCGL